MRMEIAQLHARTQSFAQKMSSARRIVREALEVENTQPYVALSGGKDSTVVYALVREQLPDVPAVWSDDAWWLPETGEYIARLQAESLDVRQIRTTVSHTEWFEVSGESTMLQYANHQDWSLCFLGLRAEESSVRRMHLRMRGNLYFKPVDDFWYCNPIHNWTWRDVWGYIVSTGMDYNRAYDRLEEIGITPEHQRIGPFAVERVLGYGQMTILKKGWPEMYNRFAAVHPEATLYV